MNKVMNFLHKYLVIISVLIGISILLGLSYSSFFVSSNDHKAAEMYIGELKYSMTIDSESKNTLTVPSGETTIDLKINNLNPVDTYYKLLYLKNSNITIEYYESITGTDQVTTTFDKPNASITASSTNNIKLLIKNSSDTEQTIELIVKGGYITNTLADIVVPTNYNEITTVAIQETNICTTTDTLTQGLVFIKGPYTYVYKQEGAKTSTENVWKNMTTDGWGVQLTDKSSTAAVTASPCITINDKPVTSMSYMFYGSQATTIDTTKFDTRNVTNMSYMFSNTLPSSLKLNNLDTSSVTTMSNMFADCAAIVIDVSNFNTSKVTDMNSMFMNSSATKLDLSNFITTNVTNMSQMFRKSKATTIVLTSFDTSNVTDMSYMFAGTIITLLNLNSFTTKSVTTMAYMFSNTALVSLDLSTFETLNVTNMTSMFKNSSSLVRIVVLTTNTFSTTNVISSKSMFLGCTSLVGGQKTTYDSTKTDKTYARVDGGTTSPGYFTKIAYTGNPGGGTTI